MSSISGTISKSLTIQLIKSEAQSTPALIVTPEKGGASSRSTTVPGEANLGLD